MLKPFSLRAGSSAVLLMGLMAIGQAHAGLRLAGTTSTPSAAVGATTDAVTATTVINVAGIGSYDEYGSGLNRVLTFNVGANALVTGIGWNVNVTAFNPSYLSELTVAFEDSAQSAGVFLTVSDVDGPGTAAYSSGGILPLASDGLEFNVGSNGILRVEFFEGYGDGVNPDGIWNSGTLTVQTVTAVPEPSSYGLMALGMLGVAVAVRRRRQA